MKSQFDKKVEKRVAEELKARQSRGGKMRWKGKTAAERSAYGRQIVSARWAKRGQEKVVPT